MCTLLPFAVRNTASRANPTNATKNTVYTACQILVPLIQPVDIASADATNWRDAVDSSLTLISWIFSPERLRAHRANTLFTTFGSRACHSLRPVRCGWVRVVGSLDGKEHVVDRAALL